MGKIIFLGGFYMLSIVGGWTNPFETYARQIGSFPQDLGWVKIKHIWNHHLDKY